MDHDRLYERLLINAGSADDLVVSNNDHPMHKRCQCIGPGHTWPRSTARRKSFEDGPNQRCFCGRYRWGEIPWVLRTQTVCNALPFPAQVFYLGCRKETAQYEIKPNNPPAGATGLRSLINDVMLALIIPFPSLNVYVEGDRLICEVSG